MSLAVSRLHDLRHDLRARARWLGEHAPVRAAFSRAAREGELFALLERDPALRATAVDLEIDGVHVPAGAVVLLSLGAANRDPAVFDNPQTFRIRRENASDHLAFSSGIHYCLGAALARTEARIALQMLYERFPRLRREGVSVRRSTLVLRGYDRLPVRLH